jgi:D-sedoheptulose 7-phosphate isomerase
MDHIDVIKSYLALLNNTLNKVNEGEILKIVDLLLETYIKSSKVFIMGNGGSGSTASHFACDINKGVSCKLAKRFKVISLNDNLPTILAYANDMSYDDIFVEQLKNFLENDDLVIGISGSGNSLNVLKAIDYANGIGATTIGITGFDGGELKKLAKHNFNIPVNDMQITEDVHLLLTHILMKILFQKLN